MKRPGKRLILEYQIWWLLAFSHPLSDHPPLQYFKFKLQYQISRFCFLEAPISFQFGLRIYLKSQKY